MEPLVIPALPTPFPKESWLGVKRQVTQSSPRDLGKQVDQLSGLVTVTLWAVFLGCWLWGQKERKGKVGATEILPQVSADPMGPFQFSQISRFMCVCQLHPTLTSLRCGLPQGKSIPLSELAPLNWEECSEGLWGELRAAHTPGMGTSGSLPVSTVFQIHFPGLLQANKCRFKHVEVNALSNKGLWSSSHSDLWNFSVFSLKNWSLAFLLFLWKLIWRMK